MKIKTKIFSGTLAMVTVAVGITTLSSLFILELGVEREVDFIINNLKNQSYQRIISGSKILDGHFVHFIQHIEHHTANLCRNEIVRRGITMGQWKSIDAHLNDLSKDVSVDFIVIFDNKGRLQNAWPAQINAAYPEKYFRDSSLYRQLQKHTLGEDIADKPIFA